jgi:hypothetical protein
MNKTVLVKLAMPLCMALSLVSTYAQSTLGALHGVTAKADGTPVSDAQVVIHQIDGNSEVKVSSGVDGTFMVPSVKPGRYELKASKGEFESPSKTVEVAASQNLAVDLALTSASAAELSPAVAKALAAMQSRIDQLEAQLAQKSAPEQPASTVPRGQLVATLAKDQLPLVPGTLAPPDVNKEVASNMAAPQPGSAAPPAAPIIPEGLQAPDATPGVDNVTPFAYADFGWMNGTTRSGPALDTKFFTPEIRFDTHFMTDFNQPIDHTMGGATESFRSGEVQVEQISVGGDFHWQNVRGRILTMNGLFATTTPRNDASAGVGQWDARNAYKYVSEAYGGYHFDVNHGLNVDAGIFVSYIGLFSYYNFDNWTYQPSYVSSNTPWFFNGIRIQWFPTNKLKIEPWIINGWQSYAKFNGHLGLGGQILWRPKPDRKSVV